MFLLQVVDIGSEYWTESQSKNAVPWLFNWQ